MNNDGRRHDEVGKGKLREKLAMVGIELDLQYN